MNLARRAAASGHELILAVRPGGDRWRIADLESRKGYRIVEADLTTAADIDRLAESKPDWIFHLAAHGAYSWQKDPDRIQATNVVATANLLAAAIRIGAQAFVHAGTSSEYGRKDHAPEEDEQPNPNSLYAEAKLAATEQVRETARATGFPACTLRLYSVYGPWEEPGRLIPMLAARGVEGTYPNLSDPNIARDFVHAADASDAFLLAAEKGPHEPGAIYNVATGVQTTLADAAKVAKSVCVISTDPVFGSLPNRGWDTNVWVGNPGLITKHLGWSAKIGFAEGFRKTVEWFRAHPELKDRYAPGIESTRAQGG